ncbi:DUF3322 domain-containing protein [Arhodomonas sp. AD133]|uniref:DUF3322 domain-containing protein n=1 Tax=Arhodomonas sp. AD133 TaxID=3415009 RepID=UPI003EBD67F3
MSWSDGGRVRRTLRRHWDRGELLAARLRGESLFPLRIPCRGPTARELGAEFEAVGEWVARLRADSRERRDYGFDIEWRRTNHRTLGANDLPAAFIVPTEADALRLLGETRAAERFDALAAGTLARLPALREWLIARPLTALEHAEDWPRILAVLEWFRAHPRPGRYLRALDIPGVDTKFIEARRGLLGELLDSVLPADAIDANATGKRGFNRRYGLRDKPARVRFRLLDPALAIHGLTDLTVPGTELARLRLPVRQVFITENEINGLTFPAVAGGMVIFGLGYSLEQLADIPWLREAPVWYWGDIDTHGFAMLDRLRAHLPHAHSLLMDRATLDRHRDLCVGEPADKRHLGTLTRLTGREQALFEQLKADVLGERLRLEQERIAYGWVEQSVAAIG